MLPGHAEVCERARIQTPASESTLSPTQSSNVLFALLLPCQASLTIAVNTDFCRLNSLAVGVSVLFCLALDGYQTWTFTFSSVYFLPQVEQG